MACSTNTSAAPGTCSTYFAASLALAYSSVISSPYSLMAMSALAPVINSLKRNWIGWLKLNSAPSTVSNDFFIFSTISARLLADIHSLKGFITIITSASSTAIGSVGTSAVPILATTCLISGKSCFSFFSASSDTSMLRLNELPAGSVICMAKSPSSRVGINSAPKRVNRKNESINKVKADTSVPHTCDRQKSSVRRYTRFNFSKKRSANVGFTDTVRFRNKEAIIGT